jgi:hypothetical protein
VINVFFAIKAQCQQLPQNFRLLPTVVKRWPLCITWLRTAYKAQIALAIAVALLITVVPAGTRALTEALYPPVKVEQKRLLGLIKESREEINPLATRRYRQLMGLLWILGLCPAGILLINHLPQTLRTIRQDDQDALSAPEQTVVRLPAVASGDRYIGAGHRYRLHGMVAKGGMGEVHLAFDQRLQRQVAAKMLADAMQGDAEQLQRFNQEALALARLSHPNIVSVLDLFEDNGQFWFIMELLPGGDLAERLRQGPIPEREALCITRDIADALSYAHNKGIIHRDIKPGNILFSESMSPKLTDFGIAKLGDSGVVTQMGLALGSPSYMSPEQAAGQPVDGRSDLYALGVTLYQMVTGELPFQGDTTAIMSQHITQPPPLPSTIRSDLSADAERLILTCLAKRPDDRFASAAALRDEINQLL